MATGDVTGADLVEYRLKAKLRDEVGISTDFDNASDSSTQLTGRGAWQFVANWHSPHVNGKIIAHKEIEGISARLFFTYLKHKLSVIEFRTLKNRMNQLEKLSDKYFAQGQEALGDECIRQFSVLTSEQALWACGLKTFITPEQVSKYRNAIKEHQLVITSLKNYAKPIPDRVAKKVKSCIDKKLFHDYEVFHFDHTVVVKTEREREAIKKAKERDPIIFGKIEHSSRYYFIADWIDEYDDLTLDKIVQKLSLTREDITLERNPVPHK